ncbi:MAG: DUF4252 domain-containing protein [Bacteroidota bacterium]
MKNVLLLLAFLLALPLGVQAQNKTIRQFYRQYKKAEKTRNFIVPGFLIKLGTGLARDLVKSDDQYELLRLARKIRSARILYAEDRNPVPRTAMLQFLDDMRASPFEELLRIQADGTNVEIMIDENGKKIKGLFIMVAEEDGFVMFHLKTRIKYKDLNRLIRILQDEFIDDEAEEEPEKLEVPRV